MQFNRRELLSGMGGLAAATALSSLKNTSSARALEELTIETNKELPRKSDFAIPEGLTYINGAYTHPIPIGAADAIRRDGEYRSRPGGIDDPGHDALAKTVREQFALLINAKPSEISYVPNTSTGENLVFNSLGIVGSGGNVVTDVLHFDGMILHLQALQRDQGLDLRIAMPKNGSIDLHDLEKLVDKKTKLIEVSLVAMYNGFQHDLKAVCDLAHAHGAYVYADIVQAAGNTPIDVRASGVDFCACSSFKWLMADFGLGFLFVKEDLLDRIVRRSQYGYYQAAELDSHFLPGDSPNSAAYTWELEKNATGHFEVGTPAIGTAHVLAQSLPYIRKLGVESIDAHRQPMLKRLQDEMPPLGYAPLTPPESTSALVSFAVKDYAPVLQRLQKAKVNARVSRRYIRISPSVFNDLNDIDRLFEALA